MMLSPVTCTAACYADRPDVPRSRPPQPRFGRGCMVVASMLAVLAVLGSGCSRREAPATLRVAVLPDMDALPFVAALQQGYFEAEGVSVELVHAGSAAERDQLLQSGRVDALVTDLIALLFYNRDATRVVGVRDSMRPMPSRPQFRTLAAPGAGIRHPDDLRGVPIAVSEGTIIEYVVRQSLAAAGMKPDNIELVGVPGIPTRMAMLESGKVQAACLPEPLASLAETKGAIPVLDHIDNRPFCCSIIAVTRKTLENHRDAVNALLKALDRAAENINADKTHWRNVAFESNLLPAPLKDSYELMDYPRGGIPPAAMLQGVAAWLEAAGRLGPSTPAYEDIIDGSFGSSSQGTAERTP